MASVYGFPLSRQGYDIVDEFIFFYWKPAMIDRGSTFEHPFKSGYKFHVAVLPRDAEKLARAVLPVLQKANLDHKVVYPLSEYETMCEGEQAGKFITIYSGPQIAAAQELVRQLEPVLRQLQQAGVTPGPAPRDRKQGHQVAEHKASDTGFLWYINTSSYFN